MSDGEKIARGPPFDFMFLCHWNEWLPSPNPKDGYAPNFNLFQYSNVNIGPVHKRDVQRAAAMLEHNVEFACILAFDVPVDRDVQLFADKEGVRIFQANIIYHLEESFLNYRYSFVKSNSLNSMEYGQ